jgi:hypothetical protein
VVILPSWGRMWLAMLGLYEYEGMNPLSPETVLLPAWVPVHPDRFYVHTRMIYAGLSYLYARRARFDLGPLTGPLRLELYDQPYESVDFAACRKKLCTADTFSPPPRLLGVAADVMARYERHPIKGARKLALRRCAARIEAELEASAGHGISPVSALLGCLVLARNGMPHEDVLTALARLDAWRWDDEAGGIRIAGPLRLMGHRLRDADIAVRTGHPGGRDRLRSRVPVAGSSPGDPRTAGPGASGP